MKEFTIKPFMLEKLDLKGNELVIYAYIYDLCSNGKNEITFGRKHYADVFYLSKPTIINVFNSLVEKKYLIHKQTIKNKLITNHYSINFDDLKRRGVLENEFVTTFSTK